MIRNKKKQVVTIILSLMMGLGTVMSMEVASKGTEYNEAIQLINQYVEEQFASLSSDEKQKLVEEIYVEKYIAPQCNELFTEDEKEDEFTDIAYQNTLLRQNYVVDLISSHSGKKTSLDDWEYNLEYLENHYEEIMKIDNVNKIYIDLYIEEYTVEKEMGVMPDKRINVERTKPISY